MHALHCVIRQCFTCIEMEHIFGFNSSVLLFYASVCPDCGFVKSRGKRRTEIIILKPQIFSITFPGNVSALLQILLTKIHRFDCEFVLKLSSN